jgi:cytoskeletal protein CcmA (bactofilin family)
MTMMWKANQPAAAAPSAPPELRPSPPPPAILDPVGRIHAVAEHAGETTIGKGMVFKGMISGSGPLFVDGDVVGNINLPESRVTVGENGNVTDGLSVCITAREIVVIGKIHGNISASDRVEIRAQGELTGNITTGRISIADGAFFRGDIDLRNGVRKPAAAVVREEPRKAYA